MLGEPEEAGGQGQLGGSTESLEPSTHGTKGAASKSTRRMLLSEEGAGEKSKAGLLGLSRLTRPHTLPPDAGREDMVDFLVVEGSKLLYQGVISIPIILWTGASEEERDAIDRIGFLFSNYTVEHYQYELVEVSAPLPSTLNPRAFT